MNQLRLVLEDPINLADYDVIIVNTSAGKDSQVMLDVIASQAEAAGISDRVCCFHADLGRVEWPGTAELAAEHAAHYRLRFEKIARPQGDLLARVNERGRWPDAKRRWCTSDFKRGQGRKLMTRLVTEQRERWAAAGEPVRPVRILNCIGYRREESAERRKKQTLRFDERASNGKRHVDEYAPILDWTVTEVWERIAQAGTTAHWAYAAGMPRLSCSFCVLASRSALVRAAQLRPDLADEYLETEIRIAHRFRLDLSMHDIVEAAKTETIDHVPGWAA